MFDSVFVWCLGTPLPCSLQARASKQQLWWVKTQINEIHHTRGGGHYEYNLLIVQNTVGVKRPGWSCRLLIQAKWRGNLMEGDEFYLYLVFVAATRGSKHFFFLINVHRASICMIIQHCWHTHKMQLWGKTLIPQSLAFKAMPPCLRLSINPVCSRESIMGAAGWAASEGC